MNVINCKIANRVAFMKVICAFMIVLIHTKPSNIPWGGSLAVCGIAVGLRAQANGGAICKNLLSSQGVFIKAFMLWAYNWIVRCRHWLQVHILGHQVC